MGKVAGGEGGGGALFAEGLAEVCTKSCTHVKSRMTLDSMGCPTRRRARGAQAEGVAPFVEDPLRRETYRDAIENPRELAAAPLAISHLI